MCPRGAVKDQCWKLALRLCRQCGFCYCQQRSCWLYCTFSRQSVRSILPVVGVQQQVLVCLWLVAFCSTASMLKNCSAVTNRQAPLDLCRIRGTWKERELFGALFRLHGKWTGTCYSINSMEFTPTSRFLVLSQSNGQGLICWLASFSPLIQRLNDLSTKCSRDAAHEC